jgi:integrase
MSPCASRLMVHDPVSYKSTQNFGVEAEGLGLPPKVVQERMGHSSITMTMDVYGHLFSATDNSDALAAAEQRLLSAANTT